MEMEIKITGCPFEDGETLNTYVHALDMQAAIHQVREYIRGIIKYEDIDDDHEECLSEIRDMLYIEGME